MTYQHALRYLTLSEPSAEQYLPSHHLCDLLPHDRSPLLIMCFSHDKQGRASAQLLASILREADLPCLHVIDAPETELPHRFLWNCQPIPPALLCPHAQRVRDQEIVVRRAAQQSATAFPFYDRTAAVLSSFAAEHAPRVVILESNSPELFHAFERLGPMSSLTVGSSTDHNFQTAIRTIGKSTVEVISHACGTDAYRIISDACLKSGVRHQLISRSGAQTDEVSLGSQRLRSPIMPELRLASGTQLAADAALTAYYLVLRLRQRGMPISDEHIKCGVSRSVLTDCLAPISICPLIVIDRIDSDVELAATFSHLRSLQDCLPLPLYVWCEDRFEPLLATNGYLFTAHKDPDGDAPLCEMGTNLFLGSHAFLERMLKKFGKSVKKF